MRTSDRKINSSLKRQIINLFAQLICDIKNIDDSKMFIEDFFTMAETETFAKRLAVAYWLKKGRSYTNIKQNIKVSSATIAEVSSMMSKKGIQSALTKIEAEEWANKWADKIKKFIK